MKFPPDGSPVPDNHAHQNIDIGFMEGINLTQGVSVWYVSAYCEFTNNTDYQGYLRKIVLGVCSGSRYWDRGALIPTIPQINVVDPTGLKCTTYADSVHGIYVSQPNDKITFGYYLEFDMDSNNQNWGYWRSKATIIFTRLA